MNDLNIQLTWSNQESLYEAGGLYKQFRQSRNQISYCPGCSEKIQTECPQCGVNLNLPRRVLNDFIIGTHAKLFAD